ncbi:MAG TPA: hypothetical protein VFZ36_06740 [Vicinamibacterales bacterium]
MNTLIALSLVTLVSSAPPVDRPAESMTAAAVRIGSEMTVAPAVAPPAAAVLRSKRGAWIGGLIGLGIGAVAGVGTAVGLATRQCGDSCADEKVLIGVSLVGMPAAGAALGALLGSRLDSARVYRKP